MPVEMHWVGRGIYQRYTGDLSVERMLDYITLKVGDERFETADFLIADYSAVTGHDLTPEAVAELAVMDELPSRLNPRLRMALVVTDPGLYRLAQQYADSGSHHFETAVHADLDAAMAWLDLPTATREQIRVIRR